MKFKTALYFFSLVLILSGCNGIDEQQLQELDIENAALKKEISERDTLITKYFQTIDEIEQNLSRIAQKEGSISLVLRNGVENKKSKQQLIIDEIQFINSLLLQNKEKLNKLSAQLSNSNFRILELNNSIDRLNEKILDKDHQLINLKNQLVRKNFKIDLLNSSLDSLTLLSIIQEELILMQEEEINTAYYCFGSKKELKQNNIIGSSGILTSKKLNENFNKKYFRKIDITKNYSIPLAVKKVELITSHPSDSYKLIGEKNVEKLLITNPKSFWEASKYLVILTE